MSLIEVQDTVLMRIAEINAAQSSGLHTNIHLMPAQFNWGKKWHTQEGSLWQKFRGIPF